LFFYCQEFSSFFPQLSKHSLIVVVVDAPRVISSQTLCLVFSDDDNDGLIDEDCANPPTAFSYLFAFIDNRVEGPLYQPLKV
jgi:hypothetical protein